MSGGTSTLWRTSLCGMVMALTVLGTGCAMDAGDSDEDIVEAQQDLTIGVPKLPGHLQLPKHPVSGPKMGKMGSQAKSPNSKLDDVADPLPEPWHPDGRAGSDDPDQAKLGTSPDPTDDPK